MLVCVCGQYLNDVCQSLSQFAGARARARARTYLNDVCQSLHIGNLSLHDLLDNKAALDWPCFLKLLFEVVTAYVQNSYVKYVITSSSAY